MNPRRTHYAAAAIATGLILALAACGSTSSAGKSTTTQSTADGTVAVAGSSASPTPAATPSSAPPPTPAAPATTQSQSPVMTPAEVVEAYFAAINAQNYAAAWTLGGDHLGQSYAQFVAGFADTATDSVQILSTSGDTVSINLDATQTDGSQQQFTGTYTVSGQAISGASVSQVGSDLCGAPPNPYGYNLCGNGHKITDPDSGVCNYFSCIDNFWNGRGYMVECADGMYSMSGGIEDVCSYHGGVASTVYSGS
ncbi:MAG TPA: hypothetical protein VL551_19835 [Actinospica sp.]|jgi:hypothetical protein|nr:hypothetical protein [Actinospica sp.]